MQRHECHNIYYVVKKEFVHDRRDGPVADASGYYAKFCVGNRVKFMRPSNLTQVANGPPLLRRQIVCPWRLEAEMGPASLRHP